MDRWKVGRWMGGCMDRWVDRQMDEWNGGYVCGWMGGWMKGWMDGCRWTDKGTGGAGWMDGVKSLVLALLLITYILMSPFIFLLFLLLKLEGSWIHNGTFSLRTTTGTAECHQGHRHRETLSSTLLFAMMLDTWDSDGHISQERKLSLRSLIYSCSPREPPSQASAHSQNLSSTIHRARNRV